MKNSYKVASFIALVLTVLCVFPYIYLFGKSLINVQGIFTLENYYKVFLSQSRYHLRFWKSIGMCLIITVGQVVVSTLAGYSFAKYSYQGKGTLFFLLMCLMIMPLQVTLVPNFIMLGQMELLDTYYALILPMIFTPLGTFIMTQGFKSIPNDVLDAAKLDGCGMLEIIYKVAIPINKTGWVCTVLLSFLSGWNMVEQPIVFISDFSKYPIAVALASVTPKDPMIQLVCCIFIAIPPFFLFSYYNQELVEGINAGGEK